MNQGVKTANTMEAVVVQPLDTHETSDSLILIEQTRDEIKKQTQAVRNELDAFLVKFS